MSKITVMIADAQQLTRLGMRYLIEESGDMKVAAEAENGEALIESIKEKRPDVLVIDYNNYTYFDKQTVSRVKSIEPSLPIVALSNDNDRSSIFKALEQGVLSYVTKNCSNSEIAEAIRVSAKGEKFFCNKVLDYILQKSLGKSTDSATSPLSKREEQILRLIAAGKVAKEIAMELDLSHHTVYTHRKNIMRKLKLNSASDLVRYALLQGWV